MRKIVALSGFKGCGKDTVGQIFCEKLGFKAVSFAQPLKAALCNMCGWNPHMLQGQTPQSRMWREQTDIFWSKQFGRPLTPRMIMQEFGTDIVRCHMLDNFWTASTQKLIEDLAPASIVVTDARFPNELNMVKSLGGHTIRIQRDMDPEWFDKAAAINKSHFIWKKLQLMFDPHLKKLHPSEREWIGYDFDHVIFNNSSLQHLERQIFELHDQMFAH